MRPFTANKTMPINIDNDNVQYEAMKDNDIQNILLSFSQVYSSGPMGGWGLWVHAVIVGSNGSDHQVNGPPKPQVHVHKMEFTQGKTQVHEEGENIRAVQPLYDMKQEPIMDAKETMSIPLSRVEWPALAVIENWTTLPILLC